MIVDEFLHSSCFQPGLVLEESANPYLYEDSVSQMQANLALEIASASGLRNLENSIEGHCAPQHFLDYRISNQIRNFARSVEDLQYTPADCVPVIVDCLDSRVT